MYPLRTARGLSISRDSDINTIHVASAINTITINTNTINTNTINTNTINTNTINNITITTIITSNMTHNPGETGLRLECLPHEIVLEIVDCLLASDEFNSFEDAEIFYPDEDGCSKSEEVIHDCSLRFAGVKAAIRFGSTCKRLHTIIDPYVIRHDIQNHDASCLLLPAKRGYARGVAKALAHGANVDALDCTVFDILCDNFYGDWPLSLYCSPTRLNLTAIHWAAFFGYSDIVALLLRHGADVHKRADLGVSYSSGSHHPYRPAGYSPLRPGDIQRGMLSHTQDEYEHMNSFGYPATTNNDPDDNSDWHPTSVGANPLFYALKACTNDDTRKAWSPCNVWWQGNYPIVIGDESGCRLAIVRMLIEAGASLTTRTKDGVHALHQACAYRDLDIVQLLLELGVDVNVTDDNGNTALHYMAMNTLDQEHFCQGYRRISYPQGSEGRILRLLLDHGIDLYRISNKGLTAVNLGLDITHTVPFTEAYLPENDCVWCGGFPFHIKSYCAGPCYKRYHGTAASNQLEVADMGSFDTSGWWN